jgi:hypothetical protein
MLMAHIKKFNTVTSKRLNWLLIGVVAFFAIYIYVGHFGAYVFAAICGGYALNSLWRLGKATITERLINQVCDEVNRETFDEMVTVERLQRLERRGIDIPSTIYTLLRQAKVNVEEATRTEWEQLPRERTSEIFEHQHELLKSMREYSEAPG